MYPSGTMCLHVDCGTMCLPVDLPHRGEHTNHYTTDAILYLQEVKKNSISIKYLRIYLDNYSQFVSNYDHWLVIGQGSG
jgi:hypothetical protein